MNNDPQINDDKADRASGIIGNNNVKEVAANDEAVKGNTVVEF